ncbi:MAG TPA: ATP-binding protein [Anaerolineae bacterium]|nr:ATP-binding protein [Anaerolineae bacterium]
MSGRIWQKRSWRGLRSQVLLWIVLPAGLLLLASSLVSIYSHQQGMKILVQDKDLALAMVAAQGVEERVARCQAALASIRDQEAIRNGGDVDYSLLLQEMSPQLGVFNGGVALLDTDGELLAARPEAMEWTTRVRVLRPQLGQVTAGEASVLLATLDEPPTGAPWVALILAGDSRVAALLGVFTLGNCGITQILDDLIVSGEGITYLVDGDMRILYHPEASRLGTDALASFDTDRPQMDQAGAGVYRAVTGQDVVLAHVPVGQRGWTVVVEEPWGSLLAPTMRYSFLAPIVVLLVALMAFLAIFVVVRQVLQPLEELGRRASKIAWGDFSAVGEPVRGIAEIDDLRLTLNQMAHRIHAYQSAMHNYVAAVTQGQEDERLRLGHELHDDTVQSLVVLSQDLERLDRRLPPGAEDLHEMVTELRESANSVITALRRHIGDLRPVYLEDLGLIPALEKLVDDLAVSQDIETEFKVTGMADRLPANTELAIFRIVQEALKNVEQHARASQVEVRLEFGSDGITAFVEDDGVGFVGPETPSELTELGHFGLMGMQERAILLGGWLSIRSEPGQGTTIVFHVPAGGNTRSTD